MIIRNVLVVTRHPGAVEWLQRTQSIEPSEVLPRVQSIEEIKGRIVVGILPINYAVCTRIFGSIHMPGAPHYRKGDEFTFEEMIEYKARINWYCIRGGGRGIPGLLDADHIQRILEEEAMQ